MKIKYAAIITARGGSKRLPKKNILELAGKPLIAWTIEAAKNCSKIEDVIVTTDSEEIVKVAIEFGARVPFKRPEELSNDTATSFDVDECMRLMCEHASSAFQAAVSAIMPVPQCFEVFAADFIVDCSGRPWLLEVCRCLCQPVNATFTMF